MAWPARGRACDDDTSESKYWKEGSRSETASSTSLNSDQNVFGRGIHQKMDPLFLLEADPKTTPENGSLKIAIVGCYKIAKQKVRSEKAHLLFRIRFCKRWPKSRTN